MLYDISEEVGDLINEEWEHILRILGSIVEEHEEKHTVESLSEKTGRDAEIVREMLSKLEDVDAVEQVDGGYVLGEAVEVIDSEWD